MLMMPGYRHRRRRRRRAGGPRRDKTRLGPARANLEELLHLAAAIAADELLLVVLEPLQALEVLSAEQRVQVRGL